MSEQQPIATPTSSAWQRALPWLISVYLIGHFLWRTLTPAHEYPSRSVQVLGIVLDALMLIGLFGVRAKIPVWLFWLAIVAGVGLFAVRFSSDAGWWTGHLTYSLR